jgi:hypothetical protein
MKEERESFSINKMLDDKLLRGKGMRIKEKTRSNSEWSGLDGDNRIYSLTEWKRIHSFIYFKTHLL